MIWIVCLVHPALTLMPGSGSRAHILSLALSCPASSNPLSLWPMRICSRCPLSPPGLTLCLPLPVPSQARPLGWRRSQRCFQLTGRQTSNRKWNREARLLEVEGSTVLTWQIAILIFLMWVLVQRQWKHCDDIHGNRLNQKPGSITASSITDALSFVSKESVETIKQICSNNFDSWLHLSQRLVLLIGL